ncbi:MAG: succinate dehydrogenase, cytochrome b556 subunit [Rickettsiaceae bacterium]|nr:MAG: succinate dehydrogenase, cytochrome b556 subunit [Rickettsiaceae bacterium]
MSKNREELNKKRPISPHLSIYRKQISTVLSIFHRITGIMLFFSLLLLSWGFIIKILANFDILAFDLFGKIMLLKIAIFIVSYCLFYHLSNGIRHLFWDMGFGFSIKAMNISGWSAILISSIMTTLFWLYII